MYWPQRSVLMMSEFLSGGELFEVKVEGQVTKMAKMTTFTKNGTTHWENEINDLAKV